MTDSAGRFTIIPACADDAAAIAALLAPNVLKKSVLPRSEDDIRQAIAHFFVAKDPDTGAVVGCVALKRWDETLAEIRSLVVHDAAAGAGLGSLLVDTVTRQAVALGVRELFTLTVRPGLFRRLGFHDVPRERFSQKVWHDCADCPKHLTRTCDETALSRRLDRPARP